MSPRPSTAEANQYLLASLAAAAVFLVSIPIAYLLSPGIARIFWLSLVPLGCLLGRRGRCLGGGRRLA
jgi:hypothetical protein